ncbi:DUF4387 domain-containing protein [Janthinobacterium sp. Mn2066]|uniref:DUF4387 domain-containing protein n=1 Tax=Janthinobacterium sp. Mn2066 TaxID=3395264 RepID=UPI003BE06AB0
MSKHITTLFDLCSLVRSKNAGPFMLTFDFMCSSEENYQRIKQAQPLSTAMLSQLYGVPAEQILIVCHDSALALKISMPRPTIQGNPGDNDCYGGQQYVPLLDVRVH